jgi:hypothetical protein
VRPSNGLGGRLMPAFLAGVATVLLVLAMLAALVAWALLRKT